MGVRNLHGRRDWEGVHEFLACSPSPVIAEKTGNIMLAPGQSLHLSVLCLHLLSSHTGMNAKQQQKKDPFSLITSKILATLFTALLIRLAIL